MIQTQLILLIIIQIIELTVIAYSNDFVNANTVINGSATATDTIVMYSNGNGDWDTNQTPTIVGIDNVTINSMTGITGVPSGAYKQWI